MALIVPDKLESNRSSIAGVDLGVSARGNVCVTFKNVQYIGPAETMLINIKAQAALELSKASEVIVIAEARRLGLIPA